MQIRKWVWVTLFLGVLVAIGFLSYQFWPSDQAAPYRTAQVEKGRLVATVSASGTLNLFPAVTHSLPADFAAPKTADVG